MALGYRVANLKLQSGERFPLLVDASTGVPLWSPTLFIVTKLRATNRATATLQQATRAIMVAHQVLGHLDIDLDHRVAEGRLLDVGELDALAHLVGLTQESLDELLAAETRTPDASVKVVQLEQVRMHMRASEQYPQVSAETKGIRLIYIRDYLAWFARRSLLKLDYRLPIHQALIEAGRHAVSQLSERIPSSSRNSEVGARQGVGLEVRQRILEVIQPNSPENPWKNEHVRIRNQLIFMWLIELGLRKGELLGIQLSDIDLRSGEVLIARRADDPLEVRKDAPNTKTKDRLLALGGDLSELTRAYVHGPRRAIKNARRLPYLFVSTGTGLPMTKAALGKLFIELRTKVAGLPEDLSPHVLRHTWNDRFSELMDERGVPPEEEEKMRKQHMGWSDSSKMPAVYTRRHIRRKTNEASLAMQAASFDATRDKK